MNSHAEAVMRFIALSVLALALAAPGARAQSQDTSQSSTPSSSASTDNKKEDNSSVKGGGTASNLGHEETGNPEISAQTATPPSDSAAGGSQSTDQSGSRSQ